jgi:hypothetical protein
MKRFHLLLAAAGILLAAAPAQAQLVPVIKTQLDSAAVLMGTNGFTLAQAPMGGGLAQGADETMELRLTGGTSYIIVGVCDKDCSDLDLVLVDAAGAEVDTDLEEDDVPMVMVEVPSNGTYRLSVRMATCSAAPCAYGVSVFGK